MEQPTQNRSRHQLGLCVLVILVGIIAIISLVIGAVVLVELRSHHKDTLNNGSTTSGRYDGRDLTTKSPDEAKEKCRTRRTKATCRLDACANRYRTFDGTCNNQHNPLWGAAETPFKRLLQPIYEDGINTPVGWNPLTRYNGFTKPNARLVSREIMTTTSTTRDQRFTDLGMLWGQYIALDVDHIPKKDSLCTESCTQKSPYCFAVMAPENDPRLDKDQCIPLTRSTPVCNLMPRQQMNGINSYLDAGSKYGNSEERARALRDLSDESGNMKEGMQVDVNGTQGKNLLPFVVEGFPQACNRPKPCKSGDNDVSCFFSGDVRANENIGMMSLHTIWNREHNRIADELKRVNPEWNGETLYQESRKIVGALHQMITFEHWLPKTVGFKGMELLGDYSGYDQLVDASTVLSFATATLRFGHAQISPMVTRLGADFQETGFGNRKLHETTFCPAKVVNEGSIDPILRGLFGTPVKEINPQEIITQELTEHLFGAAKEVPLDLASLNIQRGRDHGLPGYNDWRKFGKLPVASNFDALADDISDALVRQKLKELYGHPSNVDLFVGGLVEDPWHDSLVGPTFTCLLVEQFRRFRDGDRFWYENPGVFTPEQLAELKNHSLARVLCDSGDAIQQVQSDVFMKATYPDGYIGCDAIRGMNISAAWKDTEGIGNVCG